MVNKFYEFKQDLMKKKIAVIGLGVSNIPLIKYLAKLGCDITLFDKRDWDLFSDEVKSLVDSYKLEVSLGDNYLEKLVGFDVIFRSPSCLPTCEYLVKERDRGAYITTEIEEVIRYARGHIIGVTGSKGKTTTTSIINHILTHLGYHTYLGGNIGIPLFDKLDSIDNDDIVILELSSFQLMGMRVSPEVAVVTNISPDHLDVHASYQEYIEAKKSIFLNQDKSGCVILNHDDNIVSKFSSEALGHVKYFSCEYIKDCYYLDGDKIKYNHEVVIDTNKILLRGVHNYLNICAALNAIRDYINVDNETLEKIVAKFTGVSHRLEFVREIDGVKWYNDSASTTPDKSIAGITAFSEPVVLIAGGYDKNIPYDSMADAVIEHVSKLILFGDTKNKIYDAVMKEVKARNSDLQVYVLDSLEEVIDVAKRVSVPGEIVLFSPASASFDMFKNAYQRGDIFKKIVNEL